MRQVTATEKYRAVNEGKMAKGEFVRQMRMAYPSVISQWNSYGDTVNILKNRGYITEKTGVESYDSRYDLNISPNSIDRGVRYELQGMGHDPVEVKDKELVAKVTDRVIKNLKKDPLHYINLLSKESSHVDKNDKMKETKRGAQDVDTFNGMKKADLKENVQKDLLRKITAHAKKTYVGGEVDLKHAMVPAAEDFYDIAKKEGDEDKMAILKSVIRHYSDMKENTDINSARENIVKVASVIRGKYGEIPGFTSILKDFLQTHQDDIKAGLVTDPIGEFDDFVDLNYDRLDEKEGKDLDGDGDIDSDDYMAAKDKAIKKAMGKDEGQINERGFDVMRQVKSIIQDMAADFDGDEVGAAEELMEAIGQEYGIDFEFGAGESRQQEAIKESVKNIITKVLEEQMINEAATNELARIAEDYAEFPGMKQSIIALQDIVTDIESFYDKTREKIQKVYDSIGEIRNEEGLKVGGFLAPTIEAAFNKDLRPVTKVGFTGGLETPKVKTISRAEVDAARAAGEIEEEPKQTMFTPIAESKKK